jgi:hypothetical protein
MDFSEQLDALQQHAAEAKSAAQAAATESHDQLSTAVWKFVGDRAGFVGDLDGVVGQRAIGGSLERSDSSSMRFPARPPTGRASSHPSAQSE